MNEPKILITNDDGISSDGILALWQALSTIGETLVVAPNQERSASSHSITLNDPIRTQHIEIKKGFNGWSVNGTPADCVKIAVRTISDNLPDLVVSGINHGSNLGKNVLYSGTVSAAAEGTMLGIPSIAISLASNKADDFNLSKRTAVEMAKFALERKLPQGTFLNVNIPSCRTNEVKGKKITKQGNQFFDDYYEERLDPRKRSYYWIKGDIVDPDTTYEYDGKAVEDNYISITPMQLTLTNEKYISKIKNYFLDE